MSISLAITPNANPPRAVCHDVLLVLAIAVFSVALARIAAEIADPGGAFGPVPVVFAAESLQKRSGETEAENPVPSLASAPQPETAPAMRGTSLSASSPRPRGFLAGETAEMRERGRSGWADLRGDFALATLSLRNPGSGAIVAAMPPAGSSH